jgi:O-antigen/teichoic acid export membrane protein
LIYQLIDAEHYTDFELSKCTQGLFAYIIESLPVTVVALSAFAFGGLSRLILEQKLGTEALGIYSLGWQLVTIGTIFVSVVYRIWRLRFAEAISSGEISILLYHLRTYIFFAIFPLMILCLVIGSNADDIVRLLFSEEYESLSKLLPLFAVYIFLISIAGLLEMLWVATGKTNISMVINISFAIFLIIFLSEFSDGFGMKDFLTSSVLIHSGLILTLAIVWWVKFKRLFIR